MTLPIETYQSTVEVFGWKYPVLIKFIPVPGYEPSDHDPGCSNNVELVSVEIDFGDGFKDFPSSDEADEEIKEEIIEWRSWDE